MNNDQVKEEIKKHLKEYAEETGRSTDTRNNFKCFIPGHEDTTPSMKFYGTYYKCYGSCNRTYDIFSLYALDNGLDETKDFYKIKEALAEKYNIDIKHPRSETIKEEVKEPKKKKENYSNFYKECYENVSKTNYFIKRGITEEVINKYKLGYDTKTNYAIIPISKSFYITRDTLDLTEEERLAKHRPRFKNLTGAEVELFNLDILKETDFKSVVFITESVIDALSLEVVDPGIKTIALNGTSNDTRLIEELKETNFKGFIVLALDNDENKAGQKASKRIEQELDKLGIRYRTLNRDAPIEEVYKGYNDINEYLQNDKESLEKEIKYYNENLEKILKAEARKMLEQENALSYLDAFIDYTKDEELRSPIETGIAKLDYALNGGLYKGNLIILGAISGLGKTTLALQIADNIARTNRDVLLFSLEMTKEELIAKSISRNMYINERYERGTTASLENILSSREILNGTMYKDNTSQVIQGNLKEAYKTYKEEIAPNIYIAECKEAMEITLEEIEKRIKKQIDITETKPVVVIDYLQIIENKERGLTDIQATGKIVKNLKRLARKYKIAILVISAFNRGAIYSDTDYSSFRDTSTIEYTADVLLTLQYSVLNDANIVEERQSDTKQAKKVKQEVKDASEKDPTELTLKIIKNRNGKRKNIEKIFFYGKANYLDFRDYDING